jgi:1-deoxy-D-xylulose-5-phosphate synthase
MGKARALVEHDEPDLAIFAYGVMAINSLEALDLLNDEYKVNVYDARFARPVDIELLRSLIERGIPVITAEDHGIEGGFGSCVIDACHAEGLDTRSITTLAIPCRWIYHGSRTDQLDECGLDPAGIARAVCKTLDNGRVLVPEVTVTTQAAAVRR